MERWLMAGETESYFHYAGQFGKTFFFGFLSEKNDPHIRILAAFPALNRVNYMLKKASV
jgi:hypothetical protein